MVTGDVLWSISSYEWSDIFPWWLFGTFYGIAFLLFLPATAKLWPIRNYAFISSNHKLSAIILTIMVSAVAIPHFFWCTTALGADKYALENGNYEQIFGCYETGSDSSGGFFAEQRAALNIRISGRALGPPVGGYALYIIEDIRAALPKGEPFAVLIRNGSIIEARRINSNAEGDQLSAPVCETPSAT